MHTYTLLALSLSMNLASVCATSWPFDLTTISAPDGSITAKFVSFGATMTELLVRDKNGDSQDVIAGYDDNSRLLTDPGHPVLNAMVGRYANRIKNGTFSIPITKYPQPDGPNVYHTPKNDHNSEVTLHGGIYGWDRRNWTIVQASPMSVTYQHIDPADEGFPGKVTVFATHTVSNGGVLHTSVHATATEETPIMVTQHIYWNLAAFHYGSNDIMAHQLQVAGSRVIEVDGDAIPTGHLIDVPGTHFDFRRQRLIGEAFKDPSFQGYDNAWIYDDVSGGTTSLWSDLSGIRLDISTNQPAVQVYTASLNMPRKAVHGGPTAQYGQHSTVAIEQEGWLDAINTPEWGVDQIYYPGRDFDWSTTYTFSVIH
ncbi:galactose mutarotase-like protein [Mycena sp. CBHHK59/15]|nr:galactose mutarotase-like protein [Mycena sp. CBHHK59/15]